MTGVTGVMGVIAGGDETGEGEETLPLRDGRLTNEQGKRGLLSQCNGCWKVEMSNTRAVNEKIYLIMMATIVLLLTLVDENDSGKYF